MTEKYKSTLIIVIGLILISNYYKLNYLSTIGIIIGLLSIVSEKINDKIIWIWYKLSEFLGLIMPNILLSLVFYLVLTPLALLSNLDKKKNPLQLRNNSKSTFISKHKTFSKEILEKIW
jgi:uncharacterized membrane protein YfhO